MTDLKDKLTSAANSLGESASGAAENLQTHAKDAWDSVQSGTNRAVRESSAYVRENPVPAVIAAVGFGLVLGLLLSHREPVSFKDRYVTEPLHQSKGMLLGLLLACGGLLKRTLSSASGAVEEIFENAGDDLKDSVKPLRTAARQVGRKIGL